MARNKTASRIIEAASAALIEGDGSIEMGDVAKKAGVSVGLAYHYYGSKAGMLVAVTKEFYERYLSIANKRYDRDIPWEVREKERLAACIDFLYTDPLAPIVLGKMAQSTEVIDVENEGQADLVALAAKNIGDGQKRGQIGDHIDAELAGAAIMGAMRQTVAHVMKSDTRPDADKVTEQLWFYISGSLGLKPSTGQ